MTEKQKEISKIIEKYLGKKGAMIPLLQEVQELEGYLSKETMRYVSEKAELKLADIYGVATFYTMFRLKPQGKHIVRVCKGTACHVSGAHSIGVSVRNYLKLKGNEDTTDDGKFTVVEVACLGCCSLAPVVMIDEDTHGKLTPESVEKILAKVD